MCPEQSEPRREERGGNQGTGEREVDGYLAGPWGCGKGRDFIPRGVGSHQRNVNGSDVIYWRTSESHSGSHAEETVDQLIDGLLPEPVRKVLMEGSTAVV